MELADVLVAKFPGVEIERLANQKVDQAVYGIA